MTRLLVVTASSVGLILFLALLATRLIRSRSRGLSVRMQVFLALALIVGAFAFGLGLLVVDRVEARAEKLARAAADDESRAVAAILDSEMQRTGVALTDLAGALRKWQPKGSRAAMGTMGLELLTEDGRLLFPGGGQSLAQEAGAVFVDTPVLSHDQVVGVVRVVKPTIVVEEMLADFAPTVLAISLLLGATAALAAAWIGRAIAQPIEALSAFGEQVAAGEPTTVPSRVAGREVSRLVRSIDAMRRQLEGRPFVEAFAADLSHELKNPVAAIRASAEVLQDGALDERADAEKFVRRIHEAAVRIERLLAELLSLARLEAQGPSQLAELRLDTLAREAIDHLAADGQVALEVQGTPSVRGDSVWLMRAITNLLDNAQLHSTGNSSILVSVDGSREYATLRVRSGGAVAAHVQENLFRRFVTTREDKGGTGLGLAIVRAIAEAHSGRVELIQAGPPYVTFELRFPAA